MVFDAQGLIPVVIQDDRTRQVLMLGYMNEDAWRITQETGLVTFFSRSRQRLWTKGETSGHHLQLISWALDCDKDTLLLKVHPKGPTCHTGADTCWNEENKELESSFLLHLQSIIKSRKETPQEGSYTNRLLEKGTHKIAQKVGEEAVELVIDSLRDDDEGFKGEAADLLYHLLVLLVDRGMSLEDVEEVLKSRHLQSSVG